VTQTARALANIGALRRGFSQWNTFDLRQRDRATCLLMLTIADAPAEIRAALLNAIKRRRKAVKP
jgi:hypothetical protein